MVRGRSRGSAGRCLKFGYAIHEPVEKFGVYAALHQDPVGAHAHLSLMGKAAENRGPNCPHKLQ